jgi:hypothetical protein
LEYVFAQGTGTAFAVCPPGKFVISGGGVAVAVEANQRMALFGSEATDVNEWGVGAVSPTATVLVTALCGSGVAPAAANVSGGGLLNR